ncbi:MAG: O-antigen ligase family protein [bacterium]
MIYLILFFTVLFFLLAWRRLDWAIMFLIIGLPTYLIRFNIFGLPSTFLEVMILIVFLVWAIKNFSRVKINFLANFKKENKKIKIRYPFDWEIVLLLLIAFTAVGLAGFSSSSFGIFKAYFFEPVMLFIVVLNVIKGEKGREKILWALAVSALAVSALAIYQKITGDFINNPLWAAADTRRVVSFFGYPNAVGLYLGPIILLMIGWFTSVVARSPVLEATKQFLVKLRVREIASFSSVARNDIVAVFFIGLVIAMSVLSIYFAKSKGALLGVAAGLVVFGLLVNKKIRWVTIIALILISLGVATYKPARDLAVENVTLTNLSGQIRKAGWIDTLKMLKDGRLLAGAGLANFQSTIAPYHTPGIFFKDFSDSDAQRKLVFNEAYRMAHWQPLEVYLYPHNIFLNFWSELGLAGMLLFIWIIGKFFVMGTRNLKTQKNRYIVIGLIGAMVVVVVHGLVDVPYFKNDLAMMFWLFVAMMSLINLENKYGKDNIQ